MNDEPVIVGQILRAHGVRGEVVVQPTSDVPERFSRLDSALVVTAGGRVAARAVEGVRPLGLLYVVKLAGVDDPESARELLVGRALGVASREVPPATGDENYHFELIGLEVRRTDGAPVGRLESILETGANDVYVVRGPAGEVLLPATREVVSRVDLAAGILWVRPVPGLFEDEGEAWEDEDRHEEDEEEDEGEEDTEGGP